MLLNKALLSILSVLLLCGSFLWNIQWIKMLYCKISRKQFGMSPYTGSVRWFNRPISKAKFYESFSNLNKHIFF